MRPGGRRRVVAVVLLGVLVTVGCGERESSDDAVETVDSLGGGLPLGGEDAIVPEVAAPATPTPRAPTETSTYEPPVLDRTQLDADLARLTPGDRELFDHYAGSRLGEGTWIVAAPMSVAEARARLLGPDPQRAKRSDYTSDTSSAYAFLQVGDGIVALEPSGFADPPRRLLAALSRDGATSAVATENIEAMTRFGYARDGEIVFDAFEYAFVDDLGQLPAEVRDLARLAWDDLEGPMVETADWFSVAMAMSEKVTGVRATRAVQGVEEWYAVPLPWGAMEDY